MYITLLDTGYLTRDREGTQETVANRAGYDGSSAVTAFTLKLDSIREGDGANIDNTPIPSSTTFAELGKGSFENPKYTMKGIIDKSDATSGFQYSQLYQLRRMQWTKGVKIFYPSVTTDTYKTLIELNGEYNGSNGAFQGSGKELAAGTPYLCGRIINMSIDDNAERNYFSYTIEFIEE